MKVSLKKPMSTDTQYSSNFQPILERVRCWIVSKPIEGNCQLVDRCRSSFVGGAHLMAHASDVDGNTVLDLGDHQLTCSSPRCSYKHRRVNGKVVMMNPSLSNSIRGLFPRAALLACTLGIPVLATATQPPSLTSPNAAQHSLSGGRERSPLIDKVRNATARFRDINALSNDWVRATPCVSGPDFGAMGVHFVLPARLGDAALNADEPEALIYEPLSGGAFRLVGVEFIVFASAWESQDPKPAGPPSLEGHLLNFVDAPNRFGLEPFYELHVWAWENNPTGSFADWNARVSCEQQPSE